jgi:hypothetical protein
MTVGIASHKDVNFNVTLQQKRGVPCGEMDKLGDFVTDWGEGRKKEGVLLPKAEKSG